MTAVPKLRARSTREQPIRVCHILATTEAIAWPVNQLTRLRDEYGYDVTAIVGGPKGPLVDRLRAAGIPYLVVDFDFPMVPDFLGLIRRAIGLARLLRRERFDVVQTALWHSMLLGRCAAWLADVPVRLTMTIGPYYVDGPIHRWIDGGTAWMETVVVGCCRYIKKQYREMGVDDERLALVYYGPDERFFDPTATRPAKIREEYGWPADTPLIVHVAWFYGRLPPNRWAPAHLRGKGFKGHEELIRAAPLILREFPDARILLVGQGWQEGGVAFQNEMRALVSELGLEERVIFAGYRPTVHDVLLAADVAVQPSTVEACGGTFEALLMERPTVGTRIGGIPDMVIDGETGVLVNPGDPVDLARGICDLLRDPERGRRLGRAGRRHVLATATLSKTVADLDALYRQRLFRNGERRAGYRRWVALVRLPWLVPVAAYLNLRLRVVEYRLLPSWQAGWRPWHVPSPMQPLVPGPWRWCERYQRRLGDVVDPIRPFVSLAGTWYGNIRRGEVRADRATARQAALDLLAALPPDVRTFIYTRYGAFRRRTSP